MQKYYVVMNYDVPIYVCLSECEAYKKAQDEYGNKPSIPYQLTVVPVDGDVLASCFGKLIPSDEPSFTLRASDESAPDVVELWRKKHIDRLGSNHPKIKSAEKIVDAMIDWPNRKQPD